MRLYRKPHIISLSLIIPSLMCAGGLSQDVLHAPSEQKTLAQRLDWAKSVVETDPSFVNGYWIGYTIDKYMHENAHMGRSGYSDRDIPMLQDLLLGAGRAGPEVVQERKILAAAQKELQAASSDKAERRKVLKKVAILFSYPSSDANMTDFDKVNMSTLDGLVDLEGRPLLWLGSVEDTQSIPFLDKLYGSSQRDKRKRGLMAAVSMHDTKNLVIPCLRKYVRENKVELQCQAVFWLAQQDHQEAFDILKDVVRNDESSKVRKDSVFWIGQKATSDDLIQIIETVALKDVAREVRKQAVFALSQAPDERGVDALIRIAKSEKDRAVQKEAIFWLGQKASKKAMDSVKKIAFDAEHTDLQKQAVFAISQWSKDQSIPALSKISRDHSNPEVRKQAIFWLGQTGDPRAVDALAEIVKSSK